MSGPGGGAGGEEVTAKVCSALSFDENREAGRSDEPALRRHLQMVTAGRNYRIFADANNVAGSVRNEADEESRQPVEERAIGDQPPDCRGVERQRSLRSADHPLRGRFGAEHGASDYESE